MNIFQTEELLAEHGQTHLLEYYNGLKEDEKQSLLNDIAKIDFSVLQGLFSEQDKKHGEYTPINALSLAEIEKNRALYEEAGLAALRAGKVAAVLLAGGQGTRLGFDGPKGTFNIGINKQLSIFGRQFEEIRSVADRAGAFFHVFVMTSEGNRAATVAFFEENGYFGYPKERVHFFVQKTSPACDFNGKIFLEEKHKIAFSPNGNGGWYASLTGSDCGRLIEEEGIEWLNVYSVDNVLQRICDPVFVGATLLSGANSSSKVVKKTGPEERVGVLMNEDGAPTVVEYYELPESLANARDDDGELIYRYGVILNYLFKVDVLNKTVKYKLPWHYAKKAVPHIEGGKKVFPSQPCGYKTETLVVDMVKLMGSCLAVEVERDREFAPVKNKAGADSVDTARALLIKNGIEI